MPDSCVILSEAKPASPADERLLEAGALTLAVVLDAGTMVAFGWMALPPPEVAALGFGGGDNEPPGCWRASSWQSAEAARSGRHHFLAVLRAPNIVRHQGLPFVVRPEQGQRIVLPEIARIELEAAPLLEPLRQSTADLGRAFDFLKDVLTPLQPASPRICEFLLAFLASISQHDGFVEIVGRPDCGGLMLQGWSIHLKPSELKFGLLSASLDVHDAVVAGFERADLLSTASGFLADMKTARDVDLQALRRVYFKWEGAYFHLDVVDARVVFEKHHAVAHVKDMLKRLQGPAAALRACKRLCRPLFPGHETVSGLTIPVRLAQDVLLHAPGAGMFLNGWLLDPCKLIRLVVLKSTRAFYARLDPTWVRLPRPDVTTGFAADPLFAEHLRPWDNLHGFMTFVPRTQPIAADETFYLELVMEDESCAFLPVKFSEGDPQTMLRQILGAVNLGDPALDRIVGQHLGPLVSGLSQVVAPAAPTSTTPFGRMIEAPEFSAIVPLTAGWADFDVNLARYAGDADFRRAELVIVAARADGDQIAQALRRYAPFYGLSGSLVLSDTPLDHHAALQLGARRARAARLLFLSPWVFPREKGWISRLEADLQRIPGAAAISPTLLYEDDSLRYAGTGALADIEAGLSAARFRGYGRDWLEAGSTTPVTAPSAECCLIDAGHFAALGGFSPEFRNPDLKTLDLGLRLRAADGTSCWAPAVTLYALDDEAGEPGEYWARVRQLIDRWAFERKWAAELAAPAARQ